jgi:hypothetical protein
MDWQSSLELPVPQSERSGSSGGPGQKLIPHEQKQGQEQAKRTPKRGISRFFE